MGNSDNLQRRPFSGRSDELANLCQSITDCPHSTPKWTDSGQLVVRSTNIKNGVLSLEQCSYTDPTSFAKRNKRATPESGDLIITREAPMGEVCIIPKGVECCLGQRMVLLKPDHTKICSEYLLYAILSEYVQRQIKGSDSTGSTVSNLNIPLLEELNIPLLEPQDKIAAVLSVLDAKIELNNRINAMLEAMAKTLYDYWFMQFDFPDENGQPYKSSGGKMVYNEILKREIPDGWAGGVASDLLSFNPELSLPKNTIGSYIDMASIPTSGFMTASVMRKKYSGGAKFQNGDLVMARITPCLENGKTGMITLLKAGEIGFGSTEFIVIRGKTLSLPSFTACLSRSESFRKFAILNMSGTSGRKRIEAKILETFSMPIPSNEILKKFEKTLEYSFKKTTATTKENQQLTQLLDWLLPMLMNGQVTINAGDTSQ